MTVKDKPSVTALLDELEVIQSELSNHLQLELSPAGQGDFREIIEVCSVVYREAANDALTLDELEDSLAFCGEVAELLEEVSGRRV